MRFIAHYTSKATGLETTEPFEAPHWPEAYTAAERTIEAELPEMYAYTVLSLELLV